MRWAWAAAILVAATAVAGCAEQGGDGDVPAALQVEQVDVDPASRLGAISGVVVDEAIRPIRNATVSVPGKDNLTTGPEGTFAFEDVEPGVHFVSVVATGYLPVQTSVDVLAGTAATVRLLLPIDPTPQPFHVTIKYDGFIDASRRW